MDTLLHVLLLMMSFNNTITLYVSNGVVSLNAAGTKLSLVIIVLLSFTM